MEARYLTDLEWRICHAVNIYVFRNGRDGEQPILVHIPPAKKKNMRTVMGVIQDRVKYPVGYAKFLYKMDGTRVRDPCELEMYNNYVVASNFDKYFKCAAYGRKRSPLLVLNRESKHVRVLKLQNQNYYEWLLKKKAVGEERPPYIYPAYYTNENLKPQDLPVGYMGNFQPPEVQAPGCCYPRSEGGKTYRVNGNQSYVVNTVTVDVTPDLRSLADSRKRKRPGKHSEANQKRNQGKQGGKIIKERTPSDMINANVIISSESGTSQEVVSLGTSETEEQVKMTHKVQRPPKQAQQTHRKPKSNRVQVVVASDDSQDKKVNDSSGQSLEELRKQTKKKSGRRPKKSEREVPVSGLLPPPPPQFRDNVDNRSSRKQPVLDSNNNQEILKYVDRAIHNPTVNYATVSPPKAFFYSPEKLAEINPSSGNIQPLELTFTSQHPGPTFSSNQQWAVIRQPQQQVFAIESGTGQNATALIPTQTIDSSPAAHHHQGVLTPFVSAQPPPNHQILQGLPLQQTALQQFQSIVHAQTLSSTASSASQQQPLYNPQGNMPPAQCVVFPTNLGQQSNGIGLPASTQIVALSNPNSQNHLQQVYQLGIVQQPNPHTCIQVDARAMRQYVDNQKLIEDRFQQGNNIYQNSPRPTNDRRLRHPHEHNIKPQSSTDLTESEVDIPFTPLKTYRLHPKKLASSPSMREQKRSNNKLKSKDEERIRSKYRPEPLPKVKSRNVAIQMGYPGPSARTARQFSNFLDPFNKGTHSTEVSFILERNRGIFNNSEQSGRRFSSSACMLEASTSTPRSDHDRFSVPNNSRDFRSIRRSTNYGSSYSDQYVGLSSGRMSKLDRMNANTLSRTPRNRLSDPVIEELVTIPPPSEFRESMRYPGRTRPPPDNFNDRPNQYANHKYPYTNNDRTALPLQYMYDQNPY